MHLKPHHPPKARKAFKNYMWDKRDRAIATSRRNAGGSPRLQSRANGMITPTSTAHNTKTQELAIACACGVRFQSACCRHRFYTRSLH